MEYRWYAIQTTAGHENKVRSLLQRRIEDDPRPAEQKLIRQALVPVQDVIEIKNGKKVTVERKLYPGYVLVEMAMSQEALHVVNSIQGVIKFVGTGKLPQPLRQDEVNRLLGIAEAVTEAEMADRMRHAHPSLRFAILSAHIRDGYLAAAYKCGAWGYFAKGDELEDIVAGIKELARSTTGTFVMGPKVRQRCTAGAASGPSPSTSTGQSRSSPSIPSRNPSDPSADDDHVAIPRPADPVLPPAVRRVPADAGVPRA